MALQPGGTPDRAPVLLGLDLLRTTGRLLRHHWIPLVTIALASVVARIYLIDLVVIIARWDSLAGFLTLSLVPFIPMIATVGMLLVLRRRSRGSTPLADVLAGIASVLVPFLIIYQAAGRLDADYRAYVTQGIWDDINREVADSERLPPAESVIVLAVVAAAIAVRIVGARLARAQRLWRSREDPKRMGVQILTGYAEVLWLVLGAHVIAYGIRLSSEWWEQRYATLWWADFTAWVESIWPAFNIVLPWVTDVAATLGAGFVTAVIVPLSWLAIGVIVYGVRAADLVSVEDLVKLRHRNPVFARLTERVGLAPIVRAWKLLTNPDGRFGALVGASAMILKVGWTPVLTFCLAYLAIDNLGHAVWQGVGRLFPRIDVIAWRALDMPIGFAGATISLVLSAALLAASADALLTRFGAPTWLRLPGPGPEPLDQLPPPHPGELLAAHEPLVDDIASPRPRDATAPATPESEG